jgi:hypothetical protein
LVYHFFQGEVEERFWLGSGGGGDGRSRVLNGIVISRSHGQVVGVERQGLLWWWWWLLLMLMMVLGLR